MTDHPIVDLHVKGLKIPSLCDMGCNLDLLNEKVANRSDLNLSEVSLRILTANGEQLKPLGMTNLEFKLNGKII